jgi:hypothetical protein
MERLVGGDFASDSILRSNSTRSLYKSLSKVEADINDKLNPLREFLSNDLDELLLNDDVVDEFVSGLESDAITLLSHLSEVLGKIDTAESRQTDQRITQMAETLKNNGSEEIPQRISNLRSIALGLSELYYGTLRITDEADAQAEIPNRSKIDSFFNAATAMDDDYDADLL